MNTREKLKSDLREKLNRYSHLERFAGPMLENRLQQHDWLKNRLAILLLGNHSENLKRLDGMLSSVQEFDQELLGHLISELKGNEKGFDNQFLDIVAELIAVNYLIRDGYQNIEKISRSDSKTPDFKARKGQNEHLIEVKNIRAPSAFIHYVIDAIDGENFLWPEIYDKKAYDLFESSNKSDSDEIDNADRYHVECFIDILRESLIAGKESCEHKYEKSKANRSISRTIRCQWKPATAIGFTFRSSDWVLGGAPSVRIADLLLPLIRKTWFAIEHATKQLVGFDKADKTQKHILLNWEPSPHFLFDSELTDQYRQAVPQIDVILKSVSKRLFVRLL